MRNKFNRFFLLFLFLTFAFQASAQSSTGGSNYLLQALIAIAVLIVLGAVIMVADNLLKIEARESGVDKSGENYSIFPNFNELFGSSNKSDFVDGKVHYLKKGHDILLAGEAAHSTSAGSGVTTFAVQPISFNGISPIPKVVVEVGSEVKAGQPIFYDKKRPEIQYVAPVSGEVIAINRGAKRSISEVVILADKEMKYHSVSAPDLDNCSREDLVSFLQSSGGWTFFQQRPFNIVADPADTPKGIFISTFDSAPLAPDLNYIVDGNEAAFQKGLDVLAKFAPVHLGLNAKTAPHSAFTTASGASKHWFHGKHPAGNVGVQIHHIDPISPNSKVWTMGVQEVITIGKLFTEGRFDASRVVAVTGAELAEPQYIKTYLGANIAGLLKDNLKEAEEGKTVRMVSGDVLSGAKVAAEGHLGYYDDQVTVLEEGDKYEMFGWLLPLTPRPSISGTFPNGFFPDLKFEANTNMHGEKRAFVVTGQYESMLPMDIYPQHLMKAIMTNDFERMEGLGIHELAAEDIALCEFACTSKQPLQQILNQGLDSMREQG